MSIVRIQATFAFTIGLDVRNDNAYSELQQRTGDSRPDRIPRSTRRIAETGDKKHAWISTLHPQKSCCSFRSSAIELFSGSAVLR
jgi:hypothetical protein